MYLTAAVAVLGLAVYLSSFGPYFTGTIGAELFTPVPLDLGVVAACWPALLAGVKPGAQADGRHRRGGGAVRAGLPVGARDRASPRPRVSPSTGGCTRSSRSAPCRPSSPSPCCCSTPVSSPRRRRGPSYEQQQYGQYGGPGGYYGQLRPARAAPRRPAAAAAPWLSDAIGGGYPGGPSTGGFSAAARRAGRPRRPPGSRPTASRSSRRPARLPPPRSRRSRSRQRPPRHSPARRRRNLSRACVNFARVSLREERPN